MLLEVFLKCVSIPSIESSVIAPLPSGLHTKRIGRRRGIVCLFSYILMETAVRSEFTSIMRT